MINPQEASDQYGDFMRRIWCRIDVILLCEADNPNRVSMTGYSRIDIDLCYLQLRKCFELMMFASVLAHESFGHELGKKLRDKEWKPRKIIKQMHLVNPRFYPIPVYEILPATSDTPDLRRLKGGFLTESDFVQAYGRCGDWLHAKRKDPYQNLDVCWGEISSYTTKLVRLLKRHWIYLTGNLALEAKVPSESSGEVEVTILAQSTSDMSPDLYLTA